MWIAGKPTEAGHYWVAHRDFVSYIIVDKCSEPDGLRYWIVGSAYRQPLKDLSTKYYMKIEKPSPPEN